MLFSLCGAINHLGFRSKSDEEKIKIAHDLRNNFSYLLSYDDEWEKFQKRANFETLSRQEVFKLSKDCSKWSEINIISFILDTLNYDDIFDEKLNRTVLKCPETAIVILTFGKTIVILEIFDVVINVFD